MEKKTASAIMLTLLLTSMLTLAFNIQPAKASETIIDTHGDSRFTKYPSGPYWWSVADHDAFHTRAYNNNFWYTYCGDAAHGGDLYFGMWTPSVIGEYEVFVWIPNPDPFGTYTPTHSANYQIWHSSGLTERVVNQALRLGGWYSLGSFTFDASSSIILNDRTGEPYTSTMVAFDAIKFTQVVTLRTLTVSSAHDSPNPSNGQHTYNDGSSVTCSVSSPVVEGGVSYSCTGWSGTGSVPASGTGKTVTFTIYQASSITWNWIVTPPVPRTLTVYSSPSGVSFTANGISHTTPWSGTYNNGESVSLVMPSACVPSGDAMYFWQEWSDGIASESRTVVMNSDVIVTGCYIGPYYMLTISSSPASGIPFTLDGVAQTTFYNEMLYQGYYTVEMPATYGEYIWQRWLEDGDTNRIKTVLLTQSIWLTAVYLTPLDFSISASPMSLTVLQGDLDTSTITISSINGFNNVVALSCSGMPLGVDADFDLPVVVPPADGSTTSTLFITVDWTAEPGSYSLTVKGTSDELAHSVQVTLKITAPPPTFSPPNPKSGDLVTFSATINSVALYRWDFGDGTTAEGRNPPPHRFRGAQNGPRTYNVILVVGDYSGTVDVTVYPLEKTVEVTHPVTAFPPAFARMTVTYNWIYDDVYVVSQVHCESGDFLGYTGISIWDWHSNIVPVIKWGTSMGNHPSFERDETYNPILETVLYGGDTFKGIRVEALDTMQVYIIGYAGVYVLTEGGYPPIPFFEVNSAYFSPDSTGAPVAEAEVPDLYLAHLGSPGELRVYDSQRRTTGLVNGEEKEEIPSSMYFNDTVVIFYPNGTYHYEVVGTGQGVYGLNVFLVEAAEITAFNATNIPTSRKEVHEYLIDWAVLSQGEEGATVEVDSNGDDIFEYTFTSDSELTQSEFLTQTGQSALSFSIVWGEETFIVSVESNSTVSNFAFNQPNKEISFNVIGSVDTIGFCNVTIPKALLHAAPSDWTVLIDGASVLPTITENATHCCLYFTYAHSTHVIQMMGTWVIGPPTPPLSVSISPLSASLVLGQSVTFTSTVSGGVAPYGYQWYVNSAPVPSATSASWTFTRSMSGIYYVYLKATDASTNTSQSETARITVATIPVGGYSVAIGPQTKAEPVLPYIALVAALTVIFTKLKPKTKRKR